MSFKLGRCIFFCTSRYLAIGIPFMIGINIAGTPGGFFTDNSWYLGEISFGLIWGNYAIGIMVEPKEHNYD